MSREERLTGQWPKADLLKEGSKNIHESKDISDCVANYPARYILQKVVGRWSKRVNTRVGTLIVATMYLQLIQNRYMFRSFTLLQCSHQHCVQTVASDVEVVGYL